MHGTVIVGTQGWNYSAWVGPFYPVGTRPGDMLRTYARAFPTVEVDSTFYAIPPEPVVAGWQERTPDDFVFSLKVPQEITHERRLVDAAGPLARFVDRVSVLGPRLGVLLLQMAPDWEPTPVNQDALRRFLPELPDGYRFAIEFRNPAWLEPAIVNRLRERDVAVALVDGRWVKRDMMLHMAEDPTADFAYVRWMGPDRSITDYSAVQVERAEDLALWSSSVRDLAGRVRTVYGYFNNHYQGHSPESARAFQRLLGQTPVSPETLREQMELL